MGTLRRLGAKLKGGAQALRRDEGGAVAIMTALSLVSATLMIGGSVDVYRFELLRKRAQNTLDRCLLSAAALSQRVDPETMVRSCMTSAGLTLPPNAVFTIVNARPCRSVAVSAQFSIGMTFLKLAGEDRWDVPVQSSAEECERRVEISLMLDVSGSMRFGITGQSKRRIDALKPAAANFVTKMLESEQKRNLTSISVVPYAGQVNGGRGMMEHLGMVRRHDFSSCVHFTPGDYDSGLPAFSRREQVPHFTEYNFHDNFSQYSEEDHRWKVKAREAFQNADGSGPILQEPWWCPDDPHAFTLRDNDVKESSAGGLHYDGTRTVENRNVREVTLEWNGRRLTLQPRETISLTEGDKLDHIIECESVEKVSDRQCDDPEKDKGSKKGKGSKKNGSGESVTVGDARAAGHIGLDVDRTQVTYLQNDPKELADAIGGLQLYDGTGTANAMKWGYMLLDPAFQPEFASALDDGVIDNRDAGGGTQRPEEFAGRPSAFDDPNTYKYLVLMTDGRMTDEFTTSDDSTLSYYDAKTKTYRDDGKTYSSSEVAKQFLRVCASAKKNNVEVYTIGFDLEGSRNRSIRQDLEDCASTNSHYFNVTDGDIDAAFDAIAASIQKVRLTS